LSSFISLKPTMKTNKMVKEMSLTSTELKLHPELVAVHGVLYDLTKFAPLHPGGHHIEGAGAYDASALYASMHPGQDPKNSKMLQECRVGIHVRNQDDPIYRYDSPFAKDLLRTIRSSLKKSWMAPVGFYLRILIIAIGTLYCEFNFILKGTMIWAIFIGIFHSQIGLSIQHDASHGAISKSFYINDFFAYGSDWIGNSKWVWFQQHILWHHPHTNHPKLDPDATSAEPLIKFQRYDSSSSSSSSSDSSSYNFWYPYQHFLLHAVLALYGPSIIYNPIAVLTMKHNDNISSRVGQTSFMNGQKVIAAIMRLFYYVRIVILPWYIGKRINILFKIFFPLSNNLFSYFSSFFSFTFQ
jgi:fatty acid desaturase